MRTIQTRYAKIESRRTDAVCAKAELNDLVPRKTRSEPDGMSEVISILEVGLSSVEGGFDALGGPGDASRLKVHDG